MPQSWTNQHELDLTSNESNTWHTPLNFIFNQWTSHPFHHHQLRKDKQLLDTGFYQNIDLELRPVFQTLQGIEAWNYQVKFNWKPFWGKNPVLRIYCICTPTETLYSCILFSCGGLYQLNWALVVTQSFKIIPSCKGLIGGPYAVCTQNPGIARKGGRGSARIFWRICPHCTEDPPKWSFIPQKW